MTEEIQVTIEAIDHTSPHLPTVIGLGRANRATLGFLKDSAFLDYAKRQNILIALDPQRKCIGYVMYRRRPQQITIAHLCIDKLWRGRGVAKKLVDFLSQKNRELYGIRLWCRRDYKVSNMWPKLGFVAKGEKPAKSRGKLLTLWWLDHGHPTLFSTDATQQLESKLRVVLDAQVFLNLDTDEEYKSLISDWLQPELDLCLTDEIYNEINRFSNSKDREKRWNIAPNFTRIICSKENLENVYKYIKNLLSEQMRESEESLQRQLAITIASDVKLFVTRDKRLLDIAEQVYKDFGLSILRPTEFIVQLDELRKETEYQPRLAGTLIKKQRVNRGQESLLTENFQCYSQGENETDFQRQLRQFLSDPDKFECSVVLEGENKPLALVVYGKHKKHELEIPMLRVGHNPLSATLARYLIFQSISRSARDQRQFTRITDSYLEETAITAIQEDAFVRVEDGWLRANLAVAETASQLSARLTDLADNIGQEYKCRELAKILDMDDSIKDAKILAEIERCLWPAKIIDADIPTFIIPIQPRWAEQLFDEGLAIQSFLGANNYLALNCEAVYYRARRNSGGLKAPGRILWYVSDDERYCYVKSIRACSRLDEVIIGKPKDLYRRFKRLGVYEEKNVFQVAKNDPNNDIMAIRFSDTELFNEPIPLKKIQQILGQSSSIQSPRCISKENFAILYNLGTET